jgi:hypothetical protein
VGKDIMPLIELSPDSLNIPSLSENATDKEIGEAWNFLNRLKQTLLIERGKQAQKAQLHYQEGESRKWAIFRKGLGEVRCSDLTEKAGEEKSREVGKNLASIREGLSLEKQGLIGLGLWP